MAIPKVDKIWVDGELIPWDDAQEHMLAHTLHYGLGAFEGIRAYRREGGETIVFRLREHIDRLFESCHIATIDVPFTRQQLVDACVETLKVNGLTEAYLRPLVYLGYGGLGLGSLESPVRTVIAAFEWGAYLGDEGLNKGVRCMVSSFRRGAVDSFMSKGKICGQYVTSILAKREAIKRGYDEAIMLDQNGLVAEGSGENMFVIKDGRIHTPPLSGSILAGITRASLMTLAADAGYELVESTITRDTLWTADEVFMTGTAAEVTPIREIDDRTIGTGEPGPITKDLQKRFFAVVKGSDNSHEEWLHKI
jgi:branched-chain amino acid aminotransferase